MAKIINIGPPIQVDATVAGHATQNSVATHPGDHVGPTSGGGGTK